jgi:hypothetical protein
MRPIIRQGFAVVALFCRVAAAGAEQRPAVVELFTSQGCSSCPPADAYLTELVTRPGVLALAFHVDYWDGLGWRDRFGLSESVQRQRAYGSALHLASVYTPQVVIDGLSDFVGSDRSRIENALAHSRSGTPVAIAVRNGSILIDLGAQDAKAACDVTLVAYQRRAVSTIGRGENAGRTLTESNIVRAVRRLGTWDGRAEQFQAAVPSLPSGVTHVAVLVQDAGQGSIAGAATLALDSNG